MIDPAALERHVRTQLADTTPLAAAMSVFCAVALVYVQWPVTAHGFLLVWSSLIVLISLVRCMLARRLAKSARSAGISTDWLIAGSMVNGLLWGVVSWFLFVPDSRSQQMFLAFALAGMTAGSITTGAFSRLSTVGFVIPALIPIATRFLILGDRISVAMGLLVLIFLAAVLYATEILHVRVREDIAQRLTRHERAGRLVADRHVLWRSNEALTKLNEITARQDLSSDERVNELLRLGNALFGLDMGIVSRIEGGKYWIEHACGPPGAPVSGTEFPLEITYCVHTLAADGPVGFHDVGLSSIAGHPCYSHFRLESYLGVPLIVDGKRYGTVNFTAARPRRAPFDNSDLTLVRLLAEWISHELSKARAERVLAQNRARLEAILESLGEGVCRVSADGRITSVNRAACKLLDYSPEELVGASVHEIIHPASAASSRQTRSMCPVCAPSHGEAVRELRDEPFRRRDGSGIRVHCSIRPLRRESAYKGIVITFRDVTAELTMEEELERQKGLFENLFHYAPDAVVYVDRDRCIRLANPAFVRLFGYTSDEIVGQSTHTLYAAPEKYNAQGRKRYNAEAEIDPTAHEIEYRRRDGTTFPGETVGTPVRDGRGELLGFIGHIRDITERRRIERLKSEFISIVSHELRTPLTSIRGALGLLANAPDVELPSVARPLVEVAERNSEHLARLLDDILDIDLMASGHLTLENRVQPIMPLLEQALEINGIYAERLGVRLRLQGCTEARVDVDPDRLLQVLANLLSNASKFSATGSPVTIEVSATDEVVHIAVTDRGEGIPPEFHERVFEKFTQVDASDSRQKGGSGLGLWITRSLVERMGGSIELSSQPGLGSTFKIFLPRAAIDPTDTADNEKPYS